MVKFDYIDIVFSSLSDATRREILFKLLKSELNISEIYYRVCKAKLSRDLSTSDQFSSQMKMSYAGLSKHLRVLENAQLIKREKNGREYKFSITKYAQYWLKQLDHFEKFIAGEK